MGGSCGFIVERYSCGVQDSILRGGSMSEILSLEMSGSWCRTTGSWVGHDWQLCRGRRTLRAVTRCPVAALMTDEKINVNDREEKDVCR